MGWKLHQMGVNTTFCNSDIEEEVYIKKPKVFVIHDERYYVCRLKKSMYGLKQATCAWYEKMDGFLMILCFNKSVVDPTLYYHIVDNEYLILVLYVDDIFLTNSKSLIVECKQSLTSKGSGYDALLLGTRSMAKD
jgi:hypothetical protein